MAARTRKSAITAEAPAEAEGPTEATQADVVEAQENAVTAVTDDVYEEATEPEAVEPAKRGRKADPIKAKMEAFREAKKALATVRDLPSLEDARVAFEAEQAELRAGLPALEVAEKVYAEARDALKAELDD